ncbi:MAG TPA: ATP-binding protein [Steroidobacteraceae bacterium]|nr:ATP-binding protein [Steroidobacteraceae bacterium]
MQHIVLLEDDSTDAELIERTLVQSGLSVKVNVAEHRKRFIELLEETQVDLVISDSAVGDLSALEAVKATKASQPQSGFIIVSGGMDEARAGQAKLHGALEWIKKSELDQLPPLVRRALDATSQMRAGMLPPWEPLSVRGPRRLVQALTELSKARDLETIQRIVRTAAREINGADGATFVLLDGNLCHYADEDTIEPLWKGQRFPMATCISGWAMIHRKAAVIPDITLDDRIPQDAYRPTFVKSLVMVPIRAAAPIGAIGNYWATKREPTTAEVELIQALADSVSIAIENVQLYRQMERRVEQRTRQLQEANQSLEEFSYFVSHDLRSPIRHVGAFANILETELVNPSALATKSLAKIKTSAVTMTTMLEGLLSLARLGAAAIEPVVLDMTSLAESVAQIAREQSATPVAIEVEVLPPGRGNEILVRQVFANLMTNAVKFSSKCAKPKVVVGAERKGGEVRYFVRDNGVGFDMARAGQLFAAFRRMHSEKDFPGTGVGLAIVHRIVTRHGGRVWADAKPNEGATFFFTLAPERGDA